MHSLEIQWVFLFDEKNIYYYGVNIWYSFIMKGGNLCNKLKSHIFVFLGHSLEIQWVFLLTKKTFTIMG